MTYSNPMPAAPVYGNYSPLSPMGTQYIQPTAQPATCWTTTTPTPARFLIS